MALADMVEGSFPEEFLLSTFSSNLSLFKSMLRKLDKVEALMGAGTMGGSDTMSNEMGIVFNHAYSI